MKRILISGGLGFIGSNLVKKLLSKGYEVRILDNFSPQIHGYISEQSELIKSIIGKCEIIRGDVRNRNDWLRALYQADSVIHFASETGTGQSMYDIAHYTDVNILGTAILLDILKNTKNNIERLILASSRAIYGEGKYNCDEHGIQYPESRSDKDMKNGFYNPTCMTCKKMMTAMPTDEKSLIAPTSVYGITKQVQEELFLLFGQMTNIPTFALRYQNVYGPGQSLKNPYTGILSIFSTSLLHANPIDIYEDGLESRDFVYVDDVVDATLLALEFKGSANIALNVGSGIPISVKQVAESLKNLYLSNSEIRISGHFRVGDIRHNYASLEKIESFLGYKPKIVFDEGLHRFVEWVRTQEISEDGYEESLVKLKNKGLYK